MTLRKRIDRIEAGRGMAPGLSDGLVLFFVGVAAEDGRPGGETTICATVIPKLGRPGVTLWREDGETEADFRARAEAVT